MPSTLPNSARRGGLPPVQHCLCRLGSASLLDLEHRRLREEARLLGEVSQAARDEVRGDVEEKEHAGQEEEDDDEQDREDADEDVGEHQLAADAPEQALPGLADGAGEQRNEAGEDEKAGEQLEGFEQRVRLEAGLAQAEEEEPCCQPDGDCQCRPVWVAAGESGHPARLSRSDAGGRLRGGSHRQKA